MRRFLIAVAIAVAGLAGCRDTYDSAPVAPAHSVHVPKNFDGIVYQGRDNGIYLMNDDGTNVRTVVAPSTERVRMLTSVGLDRIVYYEAPNDRTTISYHAIDLDGEDHVLLREGTVDSTSGVKLQEGCVISPDGTRAIYCTWGLDATDDGGPDASGQHYLHIVDTRDPGASHQIVRFQKDEFLYPAFSPDGEHIAFFAANHSQAGWDLMSIDADGTRLRTVASGIGLTNEVVWSPDGATLALAPYTPQGNLMLYSFATGSASTLVLGGRHADGISWSPDGTHIAYAQELTVPGEFPRNVYVTDLSGNATLVGTGGTAKFMATQWSADGMLVQAYTPGGANNDALGLLDPATGQVNWIAQNAVVMRWVP